jgi:SAM-dependent methyltransferase
MVRVWVAILSPMPHAHGHVGKHSGDPADWTDMLTALEREGEVSTPWVLDAIAWLGSLSDRPVSTIIDVGSGPGVAAVLFGQAFPAASIIAYDGNAALLERARERAAAAGLDDRFQTRCGLVGPEVVDAGPADLIWASHVAHHFEDPVQGLRHLGETLRPPGTAAGEGSERGRGGLLAVAEGGLPMRILPGGYGVGDPGLVSRLEAANGEYARRRWGMASEAVGGAQDWSMLLQDAGLQHVATKTFLLDLPAPLDEQARTFVLERFGDPAPEVLSLLDEVDAAAVRRLVDPNDPAALVHRPDLFILSAHTVHVARRSAGAAAP